MLELHKIVRIIDKNRAFMRFFFKNSAGYATALKRIKVCCAFYKTLLKITALLPQQRG